VQFHESFVAENALDLLVQTEEPLEDEAQRDRQNDGWDGESYP